MYPTNKRGLESQPRRCFMSTLSRLFSAGAVMLLFASAAKPQTTFATITGRVSDATGAVVPKAAITARNVAMNISTSGQSNETGNYTIPQLNQGTYEVTA